MTEGAPTPRHPAVVEDLSTPGFGVLASRSRRTGCQVVGILGAIADVTVPLAVGTAVARLQASRRDLDPAGLLVLAIPVIVALAVAAALSAIKSLVLGRTTIAEMARLRTAVVTRITYLPALIVEGQGAGDLAARVQVDVENCETLLTRDRTVRLGNVLTVGLCVAAMAYFSWTLLGVALVCLVTSFGVILITIRGVKAAARQGLGAQARLLEQLNHITRLPRSSKVYGQEDSQSVVTGAEIATMATAERQIARVQAIVEPLTKIVVQASVLIVIAVGAVLVSSGHTSWAALSGLVAALTVMGAPLVGLADLEQRRRKALAAQERLRAIADEPSERARLIVTKSADGAPTLRRARSATGLSMTGVAIDYHGDLVLSGLNLTCDTGRVVCLRGPSGSGKSSVLALVPGLTAPAAGEVALDGLPVDQWSLSSLRARVAYVEQNSPFLGTTLRENLLLDGSESSTDAALEQLSALKLDHLLSRADPLDRPYLNFGAQLSGGERQRLALARAILSKRPVCLLDEPTASVDSVAEAAMLEAIIELAKTRVVLMAAHREALVAAADEVIDLATLAPAGRLGPLRLVAG